MDITTILGSMICFYLLRYFLDDTYKVTKKSQVVIDIVITTILICLFTFILDFFKTLW